MHLLANFTLTYPRSIKTLDQKIAWFIILILIVDIYGALVKLKAKLKKLIQPKIDRKVKFNALENRIIDYIPTACHFDYDSLITKSGDIMQVIKVRGFENNDEQFLSESLRAKVRQALAKHINAEDLFVYIHTIRERADISPKGDFNQEFPAKLNELWTIKNNWDRQLVNTLYITIIKRRDRVSFFDKTLFFDSILKKRTHAYFTEASAQLSKICQNIIADLKRFSPQKLQLVQKHDGYYSEPISFINYLVNGREEKFKLYDENIAGTLSDSNISYKFNSIEIKRRPDTRFVATFSIKEMHNIHEDIMDELLQTGTQFVITEAFHLVDYETATQKYKPRAQYLKDLGKSEMLELSGLDEIIDNENLSSKKDLSHCKNYMMISVLSDDKGFFQRKLENFAKILCEIGLIVIREDFFMASVFWSQIPGNMRYLKRGQYLPLSRIANFSAIHHRKMGSYVGSKWGPPITIFRALDGNPYFFNFHNGHNGNTFFIGSKNSGRTTLCRFFLSQAMKLEPKVIYLDIEGSAKEFTTKMKGNYYKCSLDSPAELKVNSLDLKYFNGQKERFFKWFLNFLFSSQKHRDFYHDLLMLITEKLFEKEGLNTYENVAKLIEASEDELLISTFQSAFNKKIYDNFFSNDDLDILNNAYFNAFDLSDLKSKHGMLRAYIGMLVQAIRNSLNGERTILVIDSGNDLADNSFVLDLLPDILKDFSNNNALILMTASYENDAAKNFGKTISHFGHQIFCSYKYLDKKYQKIYQLSDFEYNQIKSYDISKRFFLMKNDKETIVGNVNLSQLSEQLKVLT